MIFWNEYHSPQMITDKPIKTTKYDFLEEDIENYEQLNEWVCYAIDRSREHNLSVVHESCLIYYVTLYMADMGISIGVEDKYFFKKLDKIIMDIYLSTPIDMDEIERKQYFLNKLLKFFTDGIIKQYERKLFQHNIRVSNDIKQWFDKQESVSETIINLINGSIEHPHLNANIRGDDNIVFLLTYSEELEWNGLSSIDDPDRLRVLLY